MGSKRLTIREKRKKELQRQRLVTVLIVVVVALVLVGILVAPTIRDALAPVGNISVPAQPDIPNPNDNAMGNPNAPVTIVEFSDFQCPFCKNFHDDVGEILVEEFVRPGTVYFTYRSMGAFLGPESARAAEAAYCAGDQDAFWHYHATLFANQGAENAGTYSDNRLEAMAAELGLDVEAFSDCFNGRTYRDRVNQDQIDGLAAGVQGTPAFVINGRLVPGAITAAQLRQEVEAELNAGGQ
jgi:protein-disulfide isomerase